MTQPRKYLVTELDAELGSWAAVSCDGDELIPVADGPAVHVLQAVSLDIHRDEVNQAISQALEPNPH